MQRDSRLAYKPNERFNDCSAGCRFSTIHLCVFKALRANPTPHTEVSIIVPPKKKAGRPSMKCLML